MAGRTTTIQLTMINNAIWYVDPSELFMGGIPVDPTSLVGNYIVGTRGPMLHVWSAAGGTGTEAWVNPKQVVSMTIAYS